MTATKRIFTASISCILILVTFFSLMIPASAATKSRGIATQTITVVTKANWLIPGSESITLSQTKGTYMKKKYNWRGVCTGADPKKAYGEWDIVVRATDGSDTQYKNWNDSSIKLNLKPNKTYKITVSWDTTANNIKYSFNSFSTYPTWKVKSTYKVSSCY